MFRVLSPEEAYESRYRLLDELRVALLEKRSDGSYPANLKLANTLWSVLKLWKESK